MKYRTEIFPYRKQNRKILSPLFSGRWKTHGCKICQRVCSTFLDAIYPNRCLACGCFFSPGAAPPDRNQLAFTDRGTDFHLAPFVCPECLKGLPCITPPLCTRCGKPFQEDTGENRVCGACLTTPPSFIQARAVFPYTETVSGLIHRFKYHFRTDLALPLGRILFNGYQFFFSDTFVHMIIPVPLHPSRMRWRGFNHADILLRKWPGWCRETGSGPIPEFPDNLFIRHKKTRPQIHLSPKERRKNIRSAFRVREPEILEGKTILLIDDVFTTGATVEECAKELVKSGADRVHVLTLARALHH